MRTGEREPDAEQSHHSQAINGPGTTVEKEISDRIDAGSISAAQYRIFTLCTLLAMLEGYDLASMGLAVPLVAREWGVAPGAFGTALGAVWIGVATGSILLSWIGDRVGRKPVVIGSTFAIGLFSLATMWASDVTTMTLVRFLLGVAFGPGTPNIYALVADTMPVRKRFFCMTMLTAAAAVGGISGGLIAPLLSDWLGWKGIFLAGGVIAMAIGVLMLCMLWESPKVIAARGRLAELPAILAAFGLKSTDLPTTRASAATMSTRPTELLRNGLWLVSVCYLFGWICSGFTYYILVNWMPTLMVNSGWSSGIAQRSVTFIYGGSMVGGLALSWVMDRWSHGLAIPAISYAAGIILFIAAGYCFTSNPLHLILAGLGLSVGGAQYVLPAMASRLYPPRLLATALSWISALARIGGIYGPIAGGWMLLSGWSSTRIMVLLSAAPLLSAIIFAFVAIIMARRPAVADGFTGQSGSYHS
jgi:AAHS family 4-hydroxybenzoate transporter-like MFS transporter